MTLLARIKAAGCDCGNCPYSKGGAPDAPVGAVGPRAPDAVLVGESPGREEIRAGEPFVGPTGQQLNESLLEAGLHRDRLLIVNALCCAPKEPRRAKDLTKAVACCRPYVRQVLASVPRRTPVLTMGAAATLSLTGRVKGVAAAQGFVEYGWDLDKIAE